MKRKYRRPEQIVKLLREAEAKLAEGRTVDEVCRQLGDQRRHLLQLAKAA